MVVELLGVSHEEEHQQKCHQERRDGEVDKGYYPKPPCQHFRIVLQPCSSHLVRASRQTLLAHVAGVGCCEHRHERESLRLPGYLEAFLYEEVLVKHGIEKAVTQIPLNDLCEHDSLAEARERHVKGKNALRAPRKRSAVALTSKKCCQVSIDLHLIQHPDQEVVSPHDPRANVERCKVTHNAQPNVLLEEHDPLQDLWPCHCGDAVVADSEPVAVEMLYLCCVPKFLDLAFRGDY